MFTVEQRDAVRDRVLQIAREDDRVVAGAAVGSLALGGGDPYSDLDLTFGIVDAGQLVDVLEDWTHQLAADFHAIKLLDFRQRSTVYRVFVLPGGLQVDVSLTPAAEFRALGPKFRLLFGETSPGEFTPTPPRDPADVFGWGVVYALHARSCIERGRLWQAEHYVGAVRDHGLTLACLREAVIAVQARGYDDLSPVTLARFATARTGDVAPGALRAALSAAAAALIHEAEVVGVQAARQVADRLSELGVAEGPDRA